MLQFLQRVLIFDIQRGKNFLRLYITKAHQLERGYALNLNISVSAAQQ